MDKWEKWCPLLLVFIMLTFIKSSNESIMRQNVHGTSHPQSQEQPDKMRKTSSDTILLRKNKQQLLLDDFFYPASKRFEVMKSQKTNPPHLPFRIEWSRLEAEAKAPPQKKWGKSHVYLTFDDGPNQNLNSILDILKTKHIKATFFMIEPQIRQYQQAVKRLVKEGHYPGLHSVSHDKHRLYDGSPKNVVNEMEQTRKTVLKITGVDSRLTRAPYGSKPYLTTAFRNELVAHRMKLWDWNIDTLDWKYQSSHPQKILENVKIGLERLQNKQEPIVILMHVTKGTALELPYVIDYLKSKGYEFQVYNPAQHFTMNFWNDGRL